ncbi:metal ABC transporter solute-binding protein, Zn/Mn family [Actinopolyspora mortivallis]|uniref:metal ABC transporter solute-binding protein, Zn/Mn family n=1 Tax=Actinopolyspora mortivallis TaxID=33906 RepID=UPI0003A599BD|nr:zinc ABC transporter substrate-binding protein [Actinopolyspora mortivallis]
MNTLRSRIVGGGPRRGVPALLLGLTTTLVLTSCGNGGGEANGKLDVVASTDMWANVAEAVAGDRAEVEAIIGDNEADPHSYESTPRDAARIDRADLVVYNGGGYDSFVAQILSGDNEAPPSVEAFSAAREQDQHDHDTAENHADSGHHEHDHDHSGNEHVWYEPSSVQRVAERISEHLGQLRPQHSAEFDRAAAELGTRLDEVEQRIDDIEQRHGGTEVLTTAPIADLLLDRAGLDDVTPRSFVRSVESGNDPAAATVAEMQDLVDSRRPAVLVHNPQTASSLTERIRTRAENNGIPVVEMPETLPEGQDYTQWISGRVSALERALAESPNQ